MPQPVFRFKEFDVRQDISPMKVGTDSVLLGAWANMPATGNMLDIGTGTGVLALMAAQKSKGMVTAIEPDRPSYFQASENFSRSPWPERFNLINISLQDFVKTDTERFSFIISNPPFHSETTTPPDNGRKNARNSRSLPPDILIGSIATLLKPDGSAAIIYPYSQIKLLEDLINQNGLFISRKLLVRPIPGKDFHRILLHFGRMRADIITGELIIETGKRHHYSNEYKALTEPFYLFFRY